MKFVINSDYSQFSVDEEIIDVSLCCDKIQESEIKCIKNHIVYTIEFENGYIFSRVSIFPIDDEYNILFTFTSLEGKSLIKFIEYLKENHERNIMELSI